MAVPLEEGNNEIHMEYNAAGIRGGILATLLGLVCTGLFIIYDMLERRKK